MYRLKLKEIMQARNIRQKELAEKLGTSSQYVSGVVSGKLGVSINKLYEFSQALGVSISDVIFDDAPQNTVICPHCGRAIIFEREKAGN